ncbi:restriction endonuclease [Sphingobacterium faecium]|uniref:restriction endonuclease n=1 Tax=Sphingobacterium faecium TaxID=34087 RepID=UPI003209FF47
MTIYEEDIDFKLITWKRFEELCFELLIKYQFHSLVWRQGGGDSGRDIEATYTTSNSIIGSYDDKWFIECKHHKKGLEVTDISTKIDWAVAEKADHFLLITSTYLTQTTRDWLNKKKEALQLKVHLIEGKQLKYLLLSLPDLVNRYFSDDYLDLVKSTYKNWILHQILLNPKALLSLHGNLEVRRLSQEELTFLIYNYIAKEEEIEIFCEDEDISVFSFNYLLPFIDRVFLTCDSFLTQEESLELNRRHLWAGLLTSSCEEEREFIIYYRNIVEEENKELQIYISIRNRNIISKIMYNKKIES